MAAPKIILNNQDVTTPLLQPMRGTLLIADYKSDSDLDSFFDQLPTIVEKIILLNCPEGLLVPTDDRIILSLNNSKIIDPFDFFVCIFDNITVDWCMFLNTNEYFDCRYRDFKKLADVDKSVFFHIIDRSEASLYYKLGDNDDADTARKEIRMINHNRVNKTDIESRHSDVWTNGGTIHILLLRTIELKNIDINLFSIPISLEEIYPVAGRFENVGFIHDEKVPSLIRNKVDIIIEHLSNRQKRYSPGLYTGDAGPILVFALYYLQTKDSTVLKKINEEIDFLQTILSDTSADSFCSGLAGYGWLICFLRDKEIIDVDDSYFEPLDEILKERLIGYCNKAQFDQMHEGISIARYFLKRGATVEVELVLDALNMHKETLHDEIKWQRWQYAASAMQYDFGLAHGMAGIMHFLTKCYEAGIRQTLCSELLYGIRSFYQHNIQEYSFSNVFYTAGVLVEKYEPSLERRGKTRFGWCYGDPGVLSAHYFAARTLNDEKWMAEIVKQMETIVSNRDMERLLVKDACFCHGSSSLAHMFSRMYLHTGKPIFQETALYWLKVTLIMGRNISMSPTGYIFLIDSKTNEWGHDDSLLEGISGVAASLISASSYKHMDWDEAMMLS